MARIKSESLRMSKLTEDLLLLAHLDHEEPVRRLPVDLAAVAETAVGDARAIEPERPLSFTCADAPVTVLGDHDRLHQVVANLLANVRAHTPAGTPAGVEVRTDGGTAVLTVFDRGPGIPPELAGEAFERFRRADRSRTRGAGGAGLGLAIVAAIVGAHGGTVSMANVTDGTGAVVTVTLALAHPSQSTEPSPPAQTVVPEPLGLH
jgi:two-component system OmpR family sensor kinase